MSRSDIAWLIVGSLAVLGIGLATAQEEREAARDLTECRARAEQAADLAEHALDTQATCAAVLMTCVEVLSVSQACACWLQDGAKE